MKFKPLSDEVWILASQKEKNVKEIAKLIKSGKKEVKMVCGEFDPEVYDDSRIVEALKEFISDNRPEVDKKDKIKEVKIIFSKIININNATGESNEELRYSHPNLLRMINENGYKDYFKIFNSKVRPLQHFIVVDSMNILIESIHEPFAPRSAIIIFGDNKLGIKLEEHFDNIVKKVEKFEYKL